MSATLRDIGATFSAITVTKCDMAPRVGRCLSWDSRDPEDGDDQGEGVRHGEIVAHIFASFKRCLRTQIHRQRPAGDGSGEPSPLQAQLQRLEVARGPGTAASEPPLCRLTSKSRKGLQRRGLRGVGPTPLSRISGCGCRLLSSTKSRLSGLIAQRPWAPRSTSRCARRPGSCRPGLAAGCPSCPGRPSNGLPPPRR